MNTLFDYLFWRGDLTFEQSPFNNIDAIILSNLSYIPFDNIVSSEFNKSISLEEFSKILFLKENIKYRLEDDERLIKELSKTNRFKDLKLSGFVNEIDKNVEKQFSAICIDLCDNTHAILYRGTDLSIVGWKEDFNMSFMDIVPAQEDSVNYLNKSTEYISNHLRIIGHSKGGNLAVFASSFCNNSIKDNILEIYNFDGPGLSQKMINKPGYAEILDKIKTFIPQSSIVGILLEHKEEYNIIYSYENGPFQHDMYSWEVVRNELKYLDCTTKENIFIDNTIRDWLSKVDEKQRSDFFDAIFQVIENTNITNIDMLNSYSFKTTAQLISNFSNLDKDVKNMIFKTFRIFLKSAKNNLDILQPKFPIIFKKISSSSK